MQLRKLAPTIHQYYSACLAGTCVKTVFALEFCGGELVNRNGLGQAYKLSNSRSHAVHVELRMKSSHTARVQNIYAARPRRDVLVRVTALRGRRWRAFAHEHRLASAHSRMAVCSLCGGDRTQPCSPTKNVVGACGWIPHAWRGADPAVGDLAGRCTVVKYGKSA